MAEIPPPCLRLPPLQLPAPLLLHDPSPPTRARAICKVGQEDAGDWRRPLRASAAGELRLQALLPQLLHRLHRRSRRQRRRPSRPSLHPSCHPRRPAGRRSSGRAALLADQGRELGDDGNAAGQGDRPPALSSRDHHRRTQPLPQHHARQRQHHPRDPSPELPVRIPGGSGRERAHVKDGYDQGVEQEPPVGADQLRRSLRRGELCQGREPGAHRIFVPPGNGSQRHQEAQEPLPVSH
mmetsp:Transcript_3355/g.8120  ORF Transcript_3355/g.8120 Transcript_3355/m.8120 type:complete len:238 (+) Transcript_3355:1533-2246(+)